MGLLSPRRFLGASDLCNETVERLGLFTEDVVIVDGGGGVEGTLLALVSEPLLLRTGDEVTAAIFAKIFRIRGKQLQKLFSIKVAVKTMKLFELQNCHWFCARFENERRGWV